MLLVLNDILYIPLHLWISKHVLFQILLILQTISLLIILQVGDFDFNELLQESSTTHLIDKFDKNLFTRLLTNELSKLDENHSLTFELRYINHLSINEISTVMECSEGTVKSRLFYTIRKLSHKLEIFNPYNEAS